MARRKYNDSHCMPNAKIEQEAENFLARFEQKYRKKQSPPIDVPNMLDCLDDFYVEFDDLQGLYNDKDALGAIYFEDGERRIAIDNSLNPNVYPNMKGRYNFTVAHEAGHWVLHAPKILAESQMPKFNFSKKSPVVLCRSYHSNKPEIERQADRFAGYLLMPKDLVIEQWRHQHPELQRAMNVYDEIQEERKRLGLIRPDDFVACQAARDMAPVFGVSYQAMQIRLLELRLIDDKKDNQLYFF